MSLNNINKLCYACIICECLAIHDDKHNTQSHVTENQIKPTYTLEPVICGCCVSDNTEPFKNRELVAGWLTRVTISGNSVKHSRSAYALRAAYNCYIKVRADTTTCIDDEIRLLDDILVDMSGSVTVDYPIQCAKHMLYCVTQLRS